MLILDDEFAPTTTEEQVVRGGGLSTKWLGLLGMVVVAVVAWSVASTGETEQAAPDEAVASESIPLTSTTDLHDSSTSSTDQVGEDEEVVSSSRPEASMFLPDGPLGDSGLTLIAGNPLRLLDLDTGEVRHTSAAFTQPIALIGDRLIIAPERAGSLRSLDINDLDAPAQDFQPSFSYLFSFALGEEPGTIVAIGDSPRAEPSLTRFTYDALTGEILNESYISVSSSIHDDWIGLEEFTTPRAGGVYRSDGDEFARVSDGRVVAQGGGIVLVQTCDADLQCELQWHDGANFDEVDLPIPSGIVSGHVLDGGRVLVFRRDASWATSLFDLETSELIVSGLLADDGHGLSADRTDGHVAYVRERTMYVRDLESGEETEVSFVGGTDNRDYGPLLVQMP